MLVSISINLNSRCLLVAGICMVLSVFLTGCDSRESGKRKIVRSGGEPCALGTLSDAQILQINSKIIEFNGELQRRTQPLTKSKEDLLKIQGIALGSAFFEALSEDQFQALVESNHLQKLIQHFTKDNKLQEVFPAQFAEVRKCI